MFKNNIKFLSKKLGEIKAYCDIMPVDCNEGLFLDSEVYSNETLRNELNFLKNEISFLYRVINNLKEGFSSHSDGHFPKILSPQDMQKIIDTLGLGESYKVEKRTIYASNGFEKESWLEIKKIADKSKRVSK